MKVITDSMSAQIPNNTVAKAFGIVSNCRGYIMEMIACHSLLHSFEKRLTGSLNQQFGLLTDFPDRNGAGRIGMISLVDNACVQTDNVTFLYQALLAWNSMHYLIIY